MIRESNKLQAKLFFGAVVIGYGAQAFFKFNWGIIAIPTLVYIALWMLAETFIFNSRLSKSKTVIILSDMGHVLACASSGLIVGLGLGDFMLLIFDPAHRLPFI